VKAQLKGIKALFFVLVVLVINPFSAWSVTPAEAEEELMEEGDALEEQGYNPVPMIMHHIADANEWHIVGDFSIPLPVIIYNKTEGGIFFTMSSAFHAHHGEGEETVDGYKMEHSRVVPIDENVEYIDFSITKNVATMILAGLIMLFIFVSVAKAYKKREGQAPKGLQSFMEPLILFVRDEIAVPNIGEKKADRYMPYLMTVFFFIWIINMLGLIPIIGNPNVTGNIAVTMVLALITLILTVGSGNGHYWKHIVDPLGNSMPFVGKILIYIILVPIELIGILTKPFALMIRLFANITAGHIIVLSLVSLIFVFGNAGESVGGAAGGAALAVPLTLFISLLELLVAALQAFIFTLLSALFIGQAVEEPAHH
jgi:F-type H+-transporting ATPase subunit a